MDLGFSFQTSPIRLEKAFALLNEMSEECGYDFYNFQNMVRITLCEAGKIFFYYENGAINGICQSNIGGPGFHAAAIDFIDKFETKSKLTVALDDTTEYHSHRDFERLKTEFYDWLRDMIEVLSEETKHKSFDNIYFRWNMGEYTPENITNTVVTPMGRFSVSYLAEQAKEIENLSKEFFLWNSRKIDPLYFRNTALSLLWVGCCFMPGSRSDDDLEVNHKIIALIRVVIHTDPTIPIPIDEYLELCALNNVEPLPTDNLVEHRSEFPIGYRRGMVQKHVGNLVIPLSGNYLYSVDSGYDVWYNEAEIGWRIIQTEAYNRDEIGTAFDDIFDKAEEPVESFKIIGGKCNAAFTGTIEDEEDGDIYFQIIAEILSGTQITLFTIYFDDPEDKENIMNWLKEIRANIDDE
ncbi:hypothetical protein MmiAt1_06390 [Methanimicrococcus sp. At1]|uniref:Uncharacterized protein n=1 Tax=Methanimicrococcus hacksteinii TaxID=3028293 RepID=A0ABU3VNU7_9EURY|nr:hypothetical protein [Methanimicrococcus sp. At1]MDV0445083.1 hypothetical protein [Methanimicrococcus sp. At1]